MNEFRRREQNIKNLLPLWEVFIEKLKAHFGQKRIYLFDWSHLPIVNGFGVLVFTVKPKHDFIPAAVVFQVSFITDKFTHYFHENRQIENGKIEKMNIRIETKNENEVSIVKDVLDIANQFFKEYQTVLASDLNELESYRKAYFNPVI